MSKPIILLAFADYRTEADRHLRELDEEHYGIKKALQAAEGKICRVVTIPGASVEKIMEAFDEADGPVVGFHFAGHADGFQLLLRQSVDGAAFASFLGKQPGLVFVFLNACSTKGHIEALLNAGLPAVIATASSIDDRIAREFAVSFYTHLAKGKSLKAAFQYYETAEGMKAERQRGLKLSPETEDQGSINFPWKLDYREGAGNILDWNLSAAAKDPLFGLPPVLTGYDLPAAPYRYLDRFERKHAELFFGRGYQIKDLYEKVTDPVLAPIVLFYGQSGVGKSSLLEAGLLPRLEAGYVIRHVRRNNANGLEKDLLDALEATSGEEAPNAWKNIEEAAGKPLILLLDQVEEAFTKPLSSDTGGEELPRLLTCLQRIFKERENRPMGKVILSYRKEYHPDIEALLGIFELPHTDIFLRKLDQAGIQEAVSGLTAKEDLRKQYGLIIADERLPEIIADDLLEDAASAIAPVLQILLTKMWEEATRKDKDQPVFSIELYQNKKREGYLLYDFLSQKIAEIARWNHEAVNSGLVLDLLMFHTTPKSTANRRHHQEILSRYADRKEIIPELLMQIRDRYLLVDVHSPEVTGTPDLALAHDTLAPIVREEFEKSDRPGQMAERILSNRLKEWRQDPKGSYLDETSLEIVMQGKEGMRVWLVDEEEMIRQSRERIQREKRFRRRVRVGTAAGLLTVLILSALFFLQWRQARARTLEVESNRLVDTGQKMLGTDPTMALYAIYQGWEMDPADLLKSNIFFDAYRESVLYDTTRTHRENRGALIDAAFSSDGNRFAVATGPVVRLYRYADSGIALIDSFTEAKNTVYTLAFSPDDQYLLIGSSDRNVYRWSPDNKTFEVFPTDPSLNLLNVEVIATTRDNGRIISGYESGAIRLWRPGDTTHARPIYPESRVKSLAFLPDNRAFLAGLENGEVWKYQADSPDKALLLSLDTAVIALDLSPDGDFLLAAGENQFAIWQNSNDGWKLTAKQVNIPFLLQKARFAAAGRLVLTAGASMVGIVWDAATGLPLRELRGHSGNLRNIAADLDAGFIFTAAEDSTIRRWDLPMDLPLRNFQPAPYLVSVIAPAMADEETVVAGTYDGQVVLLNINDDHSTPLHQAHEAQVTAIDLLPGRNLIASADDYGMVKVYTFSMTAAREIAADSLHQAAINSIDISPDGQWIATAANDSTAVLWNYSTGSKIVLRGHKEEIMDVAFSPDGKTLVTASLDNSARSWNVADGSPLRVFPHSRRDVLSVAFLPNESIFLSGAADPLNNTGQLSFWNLDDEVKTIKKYSLEAGIERINPSVQNGLFTLSLSNGVSELRDREGNLLRRYREINNGATNYVMQETILSPDGRRLLSSTDHARLFIWSNKRRLPLDYFSE